MALIRNIKDWPEELDIPDDLVPDYAVPEGKTSVPMFLAFTLGGDEDDVRKARMTPSFFMKEDLRIPGHAITRYVLNADWHGLTPSECLEGLLVDIGFYELTEEDSEEEDLEF